MNKKVRLQKQKYISINQFFSDYRFSGSSAIAASGKRIQI